MNAEAIIQNLLAEKKDVRCVLGRFIAETNEKEKQFEIKEGIVYIDGVKHPEQEIIYNGVFFERKFKLGSVSITDVSGYNIVCKDTTIKVRDGKIVKL
jgi:hypothetical protein